METIIPSPCVRQCCLDEQDICLGCFRSLQEILNWAAYDNQQKSHTLEKTQKRREQSKKRFF